MTIVTIQDAGSGSSARIAVDRGFNCFEFIAQVDNQRVDVLDSDPAFASGAGRPTGNGIPVLFPYPNRIKSGRYAQAGSEVCIPPNVAAYDRTGNAIHGFCLDRPWRVIDQSANSVTGEFHLSRDAADRRPYWPSDCLIRIKYIVHETSLLAEIEVVNPDQVLAWLDENADNWDEPSEIGKALGVKYVVYIDLESFNLWEENSHNLYRGHAEGVVSVFEIDGDGEGEKIYTKEITSRFPTIAPRAATEVPYATFKQQYLSRLSEEIGRFFYEYYVADEIATGGG